MDDNLLNTHAVSRNANKKAGNEVLTISKRSVMSAAVILVVSLSFVLGYFSSTALSLPLTNGGGGLEGFCGDGFCDIFSEDPGSCPADCSNFFCGDGICDPFGRESPSTCPVDCNLLVDTIRPLVIVSHAPTSNIFTGTTVAITANASDAGGVSTIEIFVNGVSQKLCTSVISCSYSSVYLAGTYTYYATAQDTAGNIGRDPVSGTKSFTVPSGTPGGSPTCGNGVIDFGEDCDGTNLNGETCVSLGFSRGILVCTAQCTYDVGSCSTRFCDNQGYDRTFLLDGLVDPPTSRQCPSDGPTGETFSNGQIVNDVVTVSCSTPPYPGANYCGATCTSQKSIATDACTMSIVLTRLYLNDEGETRADGNVLVSDYTCTCRAGSVAGVTNVCGAQSGSGYGASHGGWGCAGSAAFSLPVSFSRFNPVNVSIYALDDCKSKSGGSWGGGDAYYTVKHAVCNSGYVCDASTGSVRCVLGNSCPSTGPNGRPAGCTSTSNSCTPLTSCANLTGFTCSAGLKCVECNDGYQWDPNLRQCVQSFFACTAAGTVGNYVCYRPLGGDPDSCVVSGTGNTQACCDGSSRTPPINYDVTEAIVPVAGGFGVIICGISYSCGQADGVCPSDYTSVPGVNACNVCDSDCLYGGSNGDAVCNGQPSDGSGICDAACQPRSPVVSVAGCPAAGTWSTLNVSAGVACDSNGGSPCNAATYRMQRFLNNPGICPATGYVLNSPQPVSDYTWLCATASNTAGQSGLSLPTECRVDRIVPNVTVGGAPASWVNFDVAATVECSDTGGSGCNNATKKYLASAAVITSCPPAESSYTLGPVTVVSDRSWVCGFARDMAGSPNVSAPAQFRVDKYIDSTTVTHIPSQVVAGRIVTISGTGADSLSGLASTRLFLDGTEMWTCSFPSSPSGVCQYTPGISPGPGLHTYLAIVRDAAGNERNSTGSFVALSPPVVSATHLPGCPSSGDQVAVIATATPAAPATIRYVEVYVDNSFSSNCTGAGPGPVSCSSPSRPYSVGNHTYFGRAVDSNSINDSSPLGIFTVQPAPVLCAADSAPPVTLITCNTGSCNNPFTSGPVTAELICNDLPPNASGCREIHYSINSAPEQVTVGNSVSFSLSNGTYAVNYYSVDNAGNIEAVKPQTIVIGGGIRLALAVVPSTVNYGTPVTGILSGDFTGSGAAIMLTPLNAQATRLDISTVNGDRNYLADSNLTAAQFTQQRWDNVNSWRFNIDTRVYHSVVTACMAVPGSGPTGCATTSYTVLGVPSIGINMEFPDAKNFIVPLTPAGEPNFTKPMPIRFTATGVINPGNIQCTGSNCRAWYSINSQPLTQMSYDNFARAFAAAPLSQALACDTRHSLTVVMNSTDNSISSRTSKGFFLSCTPRVTVSPPERRFVLGDQNAQAFEVTVWNPLGTTTFDLAMRGKRPSDSIAAGFLDFQGDGDSISGQTIPALSSQTYTVILTTAARSGSYLVQFTATDRTSPLSPSYSADAGLLIFSDSLPEFPAWQLAAMIIMAALIFYRYGANYTIRTRKN